jgi:CHAT domain-containing protein/tetratricopeptide (TPR) repeat protein
MMNKKLSIGLFCILLQSAAATAIQPPGIQTGNAQLLSPDAVIQNDLRPQEPQAFRVRLAAGDYLKTELIEHGVNIVLGFYDPAGKRLYEENSGTGNFDTSEFETIASAPGEFRVELKGVSKDPGKYEFRIKALRIATDRDQKSVNAHQTEREAIKFAEQNTAEGWRQALEKELEALSGRIDSGDRAGEARARASIGRFYFFLDDRSKALEYMQQALALYQSINDQSSAAFVLNNLGAVHQEMGEPDLALEYYMQSLPGMRAVGDKYREAALIHNLGWCYQTLGEFKKASDYYREALPLWQLAGNPFGEAQTVNNLGLTYHNLGDLERSLEYFGRSLELRRTLKDGRGEAQTLGNLGRVQFELGNGAKSEELFRQSLLVARQQEDRTHQSDALTDLALLAPEITPVDQGLEYAKEALALSEAVQDPRGSGEALFALGRIYQLRGEADSAAEKYKQALDLHVASEDRRTEARTMMALGELASGRDLNEARSWMEKGLDMIESLRGTAPDPDLRTSFLASVQDYYGEYVDLLMQMDERQPSGHFAELALHASERARARGLLEALAEHPAEIRQGIEPALLERERKLQIAINSKDQQWRQFVSFKRDAEAATAKRELDTSLDELSRLRGEIQSRSPRYAGLVQPHPMELKDLQRQLDRDSLLIEYWLGSRRSFLWAITSDSISSYVLPPANQIEDSAREFFNAVTNRTEDLPRIASALSNTLLGPAADRLDKKNLVVVSHGALQYLPFAALPSPGSAAGGTLLDRHEIVSLPSASVLGPLRTDTTRRTAPEKLVAILADPVFSREDPRFARGPVGGLRQTSSAENGSDIKRAAEQVGLDTLRRLRFSRVEADAIASLVPSGNRFEALDFQASRDNALSPELGKYRILHFATHGLLNSAHPELSGLVFSTVDSTGKPQDGMLRLHEIFNLSLNADLVVLSACQTALGKDIRGEGLIGLTRGFMYAGAPRVVASLWNVEDRATAELMKRFYEGVLKRQLKPAAALREAQLALQQNKRWSSPYYWAGFVLQGDWM